MDNLIMRAVIGVHNSGSIQVEADGYTFQELEKARFELIDRGYECSIVEDLGKLHLVVSRKK